MTPELLHVGGGLHRYSTDATWHLPHFEKMLGDNALALGSYEKSGVLGFDSEWLTRTMSLSDRLFATSLDAGAGEVEGAPYLWSREELLRLGAGDDFCARYGIRAEGNYEDEGTRQYTGLNVLHASTIESEDAAILLRLREHRDKKPQPERDEKAIAALNGMAAWALFRSDAERAKQCVVEWHRLSANGLPHQVTGGVPSGRAYLDDLAWMALAAWESGDRELREWSNRLVDQAIVDHENEDGGFWMSATQHGSPIGRQVPVLDGASPSPVAVLLDVMYIQGRAQFANWHLGRLMGWAERLPTACPSLLDVALRHAPDVRSAGAASQEVHVSLEPQQPGVSDDGFAHCHISIQIPRDFHINSYDPPASWLTPTSVRVTGVLGEAGFPEGHEAYEGTIEIPIRLVPPSESAEFNVEVMFQLCSGRACFAPQSVVLTGSISGRREG